EPPDGRGIVLVTGELAVEDLGHVPPPGPGARLDRQFLDLVLDHIPNLIDADQVPDVAHLRALPLVGLETAHLAASPVQDVTDVVSGISGILARLAQQAGKTALGDGAAVRVVSHAGSSSQETVVD